jgi:hypothetical protein
MYRNVTKELVAGWVVVRMSCVRSTVQVPSCTQCAVLRRVIRRHASRSVRAAVCVCVINGLKKGLVTSAGGSRVLREGNDRDAERIVSFRCYGTTPRHTCVLG